MAFTQQTIQTLECPVQEAGLSVRLTASALRAGAYTLFELLMMYYYRNRCFMDQVGSKSTDELDEIIAGLGLCHEDFPEIEDHFAERIDLLRLLNDYNIEK